MLRKDKLGSVKKVPTVDKKIVGTLSSLENACLLGFTSKQACSKLEDKTTTADNCDGKCENIPEDISGPRSQLA